MKKPCDENADDEGECGDDFKIEQAFDADAADFLEIGYGGDALHDDAENHGGHHHSNQGDERVAKSLEWQAGLWGETADQEANEYDDKRQRPDNGTPDL